MRTISEILASAESMSLEELEEQKRLRDAEVERFRRESLIIHTIQEPRWRAEQSAGAGPAHLKQIIAEVGGKQ